MNVPAEKSASFGHYLTFPDFPIIPGDRGLPHGGSWPIGPRGWALCVNFCCTEFSEVGPGLREVASCSRGGKGYDPL
jgi:hypothetical protein